ncbi:MAG: hypothetical protein KatS3mg105_3619 [Gemmatales bacterium]|nr:MAG: hypothetical protein KatS3mg105_3619 [Gemmatales bacterium]
MIGRILLILGIVAISIAGLWLGGVFEAPATDSGTTAIDVNASGGPGAEIGSRLYSTKPRYPAPEARALPADPIVIANCRLSVTEKEEVPAQRDSVILFIGTEIQPGEEVPADRLIRVHIDGQERQFKRLREGDFVKKGQLLAMLDDKVARDEYNIQKGKITVAEAELAAAEKTRDEAKARYDTALRLRGKVRTAISEEDVRAAKLNWDRYHFEAIVKRKAIELAKLECNKAKTILEMHEIRSSIDGVIKAIYKQPGEAVQSAPAYEPVFEIHNLNELRAEGLVDVQFATDLRPGMKVVVEPATTHGPLVTFNGHLKEVTGVAVSAHAQPRIVSCSLDGTLRVWDRTTRREIRMFRHDTPFLAVACAPLEKHAHLCLTGSSDGSAQLWNLDEPSPKPIRIMEEKHKGSVNCVAFSPDAAYCATAGDDRVIRIWETATGELKYRLSGHSGAVTSIVFTPKSQLLSAGRDNTLRLWTLGKQGGRLESTIDGRSGNVSVLGVGPEGKYVLFDPMHSKSLRVLVLPDGLTAGQLQEPFGASRFTTVARFSPDGQLVVTAGSSGLLLWRAPFATGRGYVLRRLVPADSSQPTCAAFARDGSVLVSGTRDRRVLLWEIPTKEEIEQQREAEIVFLDRALDASSSQLRIWARVDNSQGDLLPGASVTLVRYPRMK